MDIKKLLKGISDCSCGKSHNCPIDYVDIADGAIENLDPKDSEYLILISFCIIFTKSFMHFTL